MHKESMWKGRPCLVTGGTGFGGSHLCEQLLERGARVYVFDRWFPRNSYLRLSNLDAAIEFIHGNVTDLASLRIILERFEIDTVFHLAAQPIIPISNALPFETLHDNVIGTYCVLEATRLSKFANNLVFASSGAYYGTTTKNRLPITEDHPPLPANNIYSISKVAGDVAVRCYAEVYGIKTGVCRFMNTYGPGQNQFSTIVPKTIKHLIEGTDAVYDRSDGSNLLDFLFVGDMAMAYIKVAEHLDAYSGEAFNFGGGNPISTKDLVHLIGKLFDGQPHNFIFAGPSLPSKYLDMSKAKKLLGWKPTVTLKEGLSETIGWYRKFWHLL